MCFKLVVLTVLFLKIALASSGYIQDDEKSVTPKTPQYPVTHIDTAFDYTPPNPSPVREGGVQLVDSSNDICDWLCCANQLCALGDWQAGANAFFKAHELLETYLSGDQDAVNISGRVEGEALAYIYDGGFNPEINAGILAVNLAICNKYLGKAKEEAEWCGVAAWHFEDNPTDLTHSLYYHFRAAQIYMSDPQNNDFAVFTQLIASERVIRDVLDKMRYCETRKKFYELYESVCNLEKLCLNRAAVLKTSHRGYGDRYLHQAQVFSTLSDSLSIYAACL